MDESLMKKNIYRIENFVKSQGLLFALVVLFVGASLHYDVFLSTLNVTNILKQSSLIGILAIGMTFVILTKGIDLSVGSVAALSGVIAANLSHSIFLSIFISMLTGLVLGLISGFVIAKIKVEPFIATLAMMMAARGLAFIATGNVSVRISKLQPAFRALSRGYVLGVIPTSVIIFLIIFLIALLISKYTSFGRSVYAVGGNENASVMMGIKVDRVKMFVYAISGLLAGLVGALLASRLGTGQPEVAEGWELIAITATVIGGTKLSGGEGKFTGTLIGILIVGIITNIMNLQGNLNSWWQNIIRGLILLVVIITQSRVKKRRK